MTWTVVSDLTMQRFGASTAVSSTLQNQIMPTPASSASVCDTDSPPIERLHCESPLEMRKNCRPRAAARHNTSSRKINITLSQRRLMM